MKSVLLSSIIVFILSSSFYHNTPSDWVLQKNENGIAVYTRSKPNSSIKEVRVVNRVKSSLSGIVALLMETTNYTIWIYGCLESYPLRIVSERELYNYQVTDMPSPILDRDVICHFFITQDINTLNITLTKTGVPNYIAEKESRVRVQDYHSSYRLIPLRGDSVQIELEVSTDPGGHIPAWLVNANLVHAPFKSTEAMVKLLPGYQHEVCSFLKEKHY